MKHIYTFFCLLLLSGVAYAEEPITGAFGQVLGEVADENLILLEEDTVIPSPFSVRIYSFVPETPSKIFTDFRLYTTSVKRIIYGIAASFETESCNTEFRAIKNVLEEKYGESRLVDHSDLKDYFSTFIDYQWLQGWRLVRLWCLPYEPKSSYQVTLIYKDETIMVSSNEEVEPETQAKAEAEAGNL